MGPCEGGPVEFIGQTRLDVGETHYRAPSSWRNSLSPLGIILGLWGQISMRQVRRVIRVILGEAVSVQTVSMITQILDWMVKQFYRSQLQGEWQYLLLESIGLSDVEVPNV